MSSSSSSSSSSETKIMNLEDEYRKSNTAFGRILRGEEPASFIYQDDLCVAFHDIMPIAPVHFLVIPRKYIRSISQVTEDDEQLLGHMMVVATKLAKQLKLDKGYRLVVNNGQHAMQTVFHMHIHVIGGRHLCYPYA